VEALTDEIEAAAMEYLDKIGELGGAARAVEFMKEEIHRAAYRFQLEVESGKRTVVGVNSFQEEGDAPPIQQPDYAALEEGQKERLGAMRVARDQREVRATLDAVQAAAASGENLIPPMIDAVKAMATLGEISDILRGEWGTYDEA
jgi:methylmalonyl-CoA mutase N-terminal domain/subunit